MCNKLTGFLLASWAECTLTQTWWLVCRSDGSVVGTAFCISSTEHLPCVTVSQVRRSCSSILVKRFWTERLKATMLVYLLMDRQVCCYHRVSQLIVPAVTQVFRWYWL